MVTKAGQHLLPVFSFELSFDLIKKAMAGWAATPRYCLLSSFYHGL